MILTIAVTAASRILVWRDQLLGRIAHGEHVDPGQFDISRHAIPSGNNLLDAVLVKPASNPARASLLICHGIGETVEHWLVVQHLLALEGVASLVFDYSGYGRSSGFFQAPQSEEDAVSAFLCLQRLTSPIPVSVLGFSLGSGIAIAILSRVPADRLVLCAAFTSLRNAAVSIGLPRFLESLVPPIWIARNVLGTCSIPVLVVHGEKDRLFPVRMAAELAADCRSPSEFITVPRLSHNEPFHCPRMAYWRQISSRLQ